MRGVWIGLGLALSSAVAAAQVDQTPSAAPAGVASPPLPTPSVAASPVEESSDTEVQGEIPASFAGTWLMIQSPKVGDRFQSVWTVYTISKQGSRWTMRQLDGTAAPELAAAIKKADTVGERLQPDKDLLKVVAAMIPQLKDPPLAERNKSYTFISRDHFPQDKLETPNLTGTKFTLNIMTGGTNVRKGGGSNYFIREVQPDLLSGSFEAAIVALPPGLPPVPIGITGSFAMYRIE